jgi:orotidine-5'-phosphate decarboxylase
MNPRDRLIVALDVANQREALSLLSDLADEVSFFKIGLQLYTAAGPEMLRAVAATGANVFLDLKLHDIPNTVAKAVAAAAQTGAKMLTIHLSGGRDMIEAAVASAPHHLLLLGVTVLTSATDETLRECGIGSTAEEQVMRLTELGLRGGITGFVTSPHETESVRARIGEQMKIVTPGVRPIWAGADDQKRFMTPREAVQRGADYLVIGRPITAHPNPRAAVAKIVEELSEAPQVS